MKDNDNKLQRPMKRTEANPASGVLTFYDTQQILDFADNTEQRRDNVINNIDPDDTTLLRNPQRVLAMVDDLLIDNARLRREQKRDHTIHLILGGFLVVFLIAQAVIIISMTLFD